MLKCQRNGFTLIEVLLVIGLIAVLAAIVIIAINPAFQFAQSRNTQRWANVNTILNAVGQYSIVNKGNLPAGVDAIPRMLGTGTSDCQIVCGEGAPVSDDDQSDFNQGTYGGTQWDSANDWLELSPGTAPFGASGTFTSRTLDAGSSDAAWTAISWTPQRPLDKELPNSGQSESGYPEGNANMAGNVLLMHLNETGGTIVDSSGNGHNGTAHGGVTYGAAGKLNAALSFDGSSGYAQAGLGSGLSGNFTMEAWFYATSLPVNTWQGIVNNADGDSGIWIYGNRMDYWADNASHLSSASISANNWYHAAVTFDGTDGRLYLNGQLDANFPVAMSTISIANVKIGSSYWDEYLSGKIDEVAVYNRALSSAEIADHYRRGALKLRYQVRSGSANPPTGSFIGPDGTAGTYYSELANSSAYLPSLSLTNISDNRYFQYRAYLDTENSSFSPELKSVGIAYGGKTASACLDLSDYLTETYLTAIPFDPRGDAAKTQYAIQQTPNGRIMVSACQAELGENISVAR